MSGEIRRTIGGCGSTTRFAASTLAARPFRSSGDLTSLLGQESAYSDCDHIEGAYLRIDDDATGQHVTRGKIVDPSFIQKIEEAGNLAGTMYKANKTSEHGAWWPEPCSRCHMIGWVSDRCCPLKCPLCATT